MREGILELWRIEYMDITVEDGESILMEGKVDLKVFLVRPAPEELQLGTKLNFNVVSHKPSRDHDENPNVLFFYPPTSNSPKQQQYLFTTKVVPRFLSHFFSILKSLVWLDHIHPRTSTISRC